MQAGAQWKDAGLGMGYGFGSQDQFDATRTAFASARYTHRWGAWRLDAQAAYRANYDRYEWHRGQRLYGNFHFAQTASAAVATHYASRVGTTSFGVSVRNENIHSTNLGDTINPNGQVPNVADFPLSEVRVLDLVRGGNRFHANYYAEQTFYYAGLSASIGINGTYNTRFGHHIGGGANIGYAFRRGGKVYVNANRALRMPTFTDLYYNAGNQLGNRHLKPEEAWLLSVGYKGEWRLGNHPSPNTHHHSLSVSADWSLGKKHHRLGLCAGGYQTSLPRHEPAAGECDWGGTERRLPAQRVAQVRVGGLRLYLSGFGSEGERFALSGLSEPQTSYPSGARDLQRFRRLVDCAVSETRGAV